MVTERSVGVTEPTLDHLREALIAHYGSDYGVHSPTYITRFTDMTRQAETYRKGRVLLAGDAAHIHYPAGGFGMGLGIQDAVNLGWKLAEVVKGAAPESLLDTYHAERHPVAASMLRYTMATVALSRSDDRTKALSAIVSELVGMAEPRLVTAGRMSGLDIRYDLGEGHPLLGRRMPDLEVATADGPVRVYTQLHDARPVLLNLGRPGGLDAGPWADHVRTLDARYDGVWDLPVIGAVPRTLRRADPSRRLCRLGRTGDGRGSRRSAHHLVRTAVVNAQLRWLGVIGSSSSRLATTPPVEPTFSPLRTRPSR